MEALGIQEPFDGEVPRLILGGREFGKVMIMSKIRRCHIAEQTCISNGVNDNDYPNNGQCRLKYWAVAVALRNYAGNV